jgi:hypothetical protein
MKWLRYQRVISLKIQVGNTNQRNKWANTDPRRYRRWDHRDFKSNGLIDYSLFYVLLKNISVIWRRHYCRWRAAQFRPILQNLGLCSAFRALGQGWIFIVPQLLWHGTSVFPKDHPIHSPLTTRMWRTYSNPDPHGAKSDGRKSNGGNVWKSQLFRMSIKSVW